MKFSINYSGRPMGRYYQPFRLNIDHFSAIPQQDIALSISEFWLQRNSYLRDMSFFSIHLLAPKASEASGGLSISVQGF